MGERGADVRYVAGLRGRRGAVLGLAAAAIVGAALGCSVKWAAADTPEKFEQARERMVSGQIEARGVRDARVLAALRRVPRHEFVPVGQRAYAYEDRPLPIGHGQTISQPYIVAVMSQALELDGSEKVLEIGTGSGYQAAVLAELAAEVYTIEIVTAAPDHIPQPLVDQLAVGGRLVLPVGRMIQELVLITKDEKGVRHEDLLPVRFVPMVGEAEKKR